MPKSRTSWKLERTTFARHQRSNPASSVSNPSNQLHRSHSPSGMAWLEYVLDAKTAHWLQYSRTILCWIWWKRIIKHFVPLRLVRSLGISTWRRWCKMILRLILGNWSIGVIGNEWNARFQNGSRWFHEVGPLRWTIFHPLLPLVRLLSSFHGLGFHFA